jgi:hypothetical protein
MKIYVKRTIRIQLNSWFRAHDNLITRTRATAIGLTKDEIHGFLARNEWERLHPSIFRDASSPRSHRQLLVAALLAAGHGAVASHQSAACIWGLVSEPPVEPEVTVPERWGRKLKGVKVHRSPGPDQPKAVLHDGIWVTTPLRALADMAGSADVSVLKDAIDRGATTRLFTPKAMVAELQRRARQGRPGIAKLREALTERGVIGAPRPSVLERMMYDLMTRFNLPSADIEVEVGPDGEYRLDIAYVGIKFSIEVDGYIWHITPEHQQWDHSRRNKLETDGWHNLIYTYLDVARRPEYVAAEIMRMYRRLMAAVPRDVGWAEPT